ncbi:cytosine permease [Actinoallomurus sp. NPDC052308]|uniref:purine-cytosine permease family protein n=1 Tax=Actinoallomurus sp. NPDC052308 TaxID=3155530 RepID=UPI0034399629
MTPESVDEPAARPKATEVEPYGIETIPADHRHSRPLDLFRITFGGANTFATIILGTIPIASGLSFWNAVLATVTGVFLGALILSPMALFGPRNGTNNAVSSGAHFGVVGRIVGSYLSLLTAIAFYAISVWVSGDAFVGGANRLFHVPDNDLVRGLVYAAFGLLVIVICVYGYAFMLLVNKVVVVLGTALILLAIVAYSGTFHASYAGDPHLYLGGSFTATFVASVLITMANPISFGAFLGDWSRYIPDTHRPRTLMAAPFFAQLCSLIPFLFGVATATLVTNAADYTAGLIKISPLWYALLLLVVAFLGGMSTGVTALYGTGLDFSSVFPRLNRVRSTLLIGTLAFVFIIVGRFVFNLVDSINAFATLIILCTSPWMVIMSIGYFVRRGHYVSADLQVFNRGQRGGAYWFNRGVNWRSMATWIVATAAGLLFANVPPLLRGPFRDVAGGIDISLVVTLVSAVVLYVAALYLFPEPSYVFPDEGPRVVPVRSGARPAVVDDPKASVHRVRHRTKVLAGSPEERPNA